MDRSLILVDFENKLFLFYIPDGSINFRILNSNQREFREKRFSGLSEECACLLFWARSF